MLNPDYLLGFYIFVKPVVVNLDSIEGDSSLNQASIMNLVTHFNIIHKNCHDDAARADRNMRKPKSEWEGARIRNQHTKCNAWFPILGPELTENSYDVAVDMMYGSYEFVDCKRGINAIHDLRLMLSKFAYETSFTKDSKGGGPEYNLSAIPHMLNLAWFLSKSDVEIAEGS
jgi:E3 ubiquitin-protein ligase UBR4